MWYEKAYFRHLCDMHIDDWDESFLTQLCPETYVQNLKTAKIQSAMLYFQSHVGLCYYPTKSGKLHAGFIGREDTMRQIAALCHKEGIFVTGYYSLIYNTWAHDMFPAWRMVNANGQSTRGGADGNVAMEFSDNAKARRYGLCCPNNADYRTFVETQIREMADYFIVDGMFYDMLFWPHMCYCDSCRARWAKEVGGEIPTKEDWTDARWLLHMQKRREWMGEFAHWVSVLTKQVFGNVSVEHNVAYSALPSGTTANTEEVISACDYAGGDLYRGQFTQSFVCKFYKNISKHQPFEYMFSRCAPNLSAHTQIKSADILKSVAFVTAAHHGASLAIDAIDPVGTMDARVYNRLGEVFDAVLPYTPYFKGEMVEDIGLYYSLKSKFNPRGENNTNYNAVTNTTETLIEENLLFGVTGGFHDLYKYKLLIASCLTDEDAYDNVRIIKYVQDGGNLYLSGADNAKLLQTFFGASVKGYTDEGVVYIAPEERLAKSFEYFTKDFPLHSNGRAPITDGIADALAYITLPYTRQDEIRFSSIHSNPPGVKTKIPAMAFTNFGKGRVLWSALPIECMPLYDYRRIFINLIQNFLAFTPTLTSDAPEDVELTLFETDGSLYVNAVQYNSRYKARRTADFEIACKCEKPVKKVYLLPDKTPVDFTCTDDGVRFTVKDFKLFSMYEINLAEESQSS